VTYVSVAAPEAGTSAPEVDGPAHEIHRLDQFANLFVTIAPLALLGLAAWQVWDKALHWQDIVIFAVMYSACGIGITVGYHRLFTHRSFKTSTAMRVLLAILGSMALEGPVIDWVSFHRKHHAFSDEEGDPHSPHVGHGAGVLGALRGLFYAHVGWVVFSHEQAAEERYAPDLLAEPAVKFVDSTFLLWVALGLAIPFGLGVAMTGTIFGGLTGLLWGGAVRIFVLHHFTFSINSLCHFFGRKRFDTGDESRNLAWLAPFTFGEAWHNNHHAFPTMAEHGMGRRQFDVAGIFIRMLERTGLAWDVVRVSPERAAEKVLAAS
jgi:stearoyl-CoA desaturase (Delta-9 desaturase)